MEQRLDAVEKLVSQLLEKINQLESTVDELEEENTLLKRRLDDAEKDIIELGESLNDSCFKQCRICWRKTSQTCPTCKRITCDNCQDEGLCKTCRLHGSQ